MGAPVRLTRAEFFGDGTLPIEITRRSPQPPFPLHTHEFSELVIIFAGRGTHFTADAEYAVETGDAFVIQGDTAHGYRDLDGLTLVNIMFDPMALRVSETDLLSIPGYHALVTVEPQYRRGHRSAGRLRLSPAELDEVGRLVDALERESGARRPGYQSMVVAYFMQIVGYLARSFNRLKSAESAPLLQIGRAIGLLEANLARRVSSGELVRVSGMSESSLLRAFRKSVGFSPVDYHIRLRIRGACALLRDPRLSITEAAFRVGFQDSNYFSRQFRRVMGTTPRAFRASLLGAVPTAGERLADVSGARVRAAVDGAGAPAERRAAVEAPGTPAERRAAAANGGAPAKRGSAAGTLAGARRRP